MQCPINPGRYTRIPVRATLGWFVAERTLGNASYRVRESVMLRGGGACPPVRYDAQAFEQIDRTIAAFWPTWSPSC
jgi:hypothetical protein